MRVSPDRFELSTPALSEQNSNQAKLRAHNQIRKKIIYKDLHKLDLIYNCLSVTTISFISLLAFKKKTIQILPMAIDKTIITIMEKLPTICFAISAMATPIK